MRISLDKSVGFETLSPALARDVQGSIKEAIRLGAVLAGGTQPVRIFREAVRVALQKIESLNGGLLLRFLNPGPYPDFQKNPKFDEADFLSDQEAADTINFVFGSMMNMFKGALAELLAAGPIASRVASLKEKKIFPEDVQLLVGDAVLAPQARGRFAKTGDFHILKLDRTKRTAHVYGIGEVKSYRRSVGKVSLQITQNLMRSAATLRILDSTYEISLSENPLRIRVIPAACRPRVDFKLEKSSGSASVTTSLVDEPDRRDEWATVGRESVLTLRWPQRALEEAAYGFTFWYMSELGSRAFASGVPAEWSDMSSSELGVNAAKSALYCALMRLKSGTPVEQKAIALFNSYGFGYWIGMNFRNQSGRRVMLFHEDLEEILEKGYSTVKVNGKTERRSIRGYPVQVPVVSLNEEPK